PGARHDAPAAGKAAPAHAGHVAAAAAGTKQAASTPDAGAADARPALAVGPARRTVSADHPDIDRGSEMMRVARFVASGGASLRGRVLEADGDRPVAGADVEVRLDRQYVLTSTNEGGQFSLPGMVPGSRVVVWIGGKRGVLVDERIDVALPGEGQIAD